MVRLVVLGSCLTVAVRSAHKGRKEQHNPDDIFDRTLVSLFAFSLRLRGPGMAEYRGSRTPEGLQRGAKNTVKKVKI